MYCLGEREQWGAALPRLDRLAWLQGGGDHLVCGEGGAQRRDVPRHSHTTQGGGPHSLGWAHRGEEKLSGGVKDFFSFVFLPLDVRIHKIYQSFA